MSIDLSKPLIADDAEKDPAYAKISSEIQGNILKSHGRGHTSHIFFQFNENKLAEAKQFIAYIGENEVFSAHRQKQVTERFKNNLPIDAQDQVFVGFYLSKAGYQYLGLQAPQGLNSMKERQDILQDPPTELWEDGFREEVHAMILLAWGTSSDEVSKQLHRIPLEQKTSLMLKLVQSGNLATVLAVERGDGIKRRHTLDDIEHFGYVDGISQPLLFTSEQPFTPNFWNPVMPPSLVLVEDNTVDRAVHSNAYGSFLVFRKLEQNVKGFKQREQELADELSLNGEEEREKAGAMVVGRFENGMPFTISEEDSKPPAITWHNTGSFNDYDYSNDAEGARCPFHAHVRKSNPRNGNQIGKSDDQLKQHMMARRGIIYGNRKMHPNEEPIDAMPTGGVGLLFMAFQGNLENQFEYIQSRFVNNKDLLAPNAGLDPIIGQGLFHPTQRYAKSYGDPASQKTCSIFGGFVTLKGGEYFFAPSMAFFKTITQQP